MKKDLPGTWNVLEGRGKAAESLSKESRSPGLSPGPSGYKSAALTARSGHPSGWQLRTFTVQQKHGWTQLTPADLTLSLPSVLSNFNPLNAELNPICNLLALLGAHHFLHVSRIRVKSLTLKLLMSYIYIYTHMEHPFLMFLDHTQRRSTVGRTPLDE